MPSLNFCGLSLGKGGGERGMYLNCSLKYKGNSFVHVVAGDCAVKSSALKLHDSCHQTRHPNQLMIIPYHDPLFSLPLKYPF